MAKVLVDDGFVQQLIWAKLFAATIKDNPIVVISFFIVCGFCMLSYYFIEKEILRFVKAGVGFLVAQRNSMPAKANFILTELNFMLA